MGLLKTFEVAIYNEEVREKIEEGARHRDLSDAWADTHYIEIQAETADEARMKIARRYPASQGYVIVDVSISKFDEN